MTKVRLLNNKKEICTIGAENTDYPWGSMIIAILTILASVFLSPYLNIFAAVIILGRMVRYGSIVFSTDYCILVTVSQIFQVNGTFLLPYFCLAAALWFVCTKSFRADLVTMLLIMQFAYLFLRMHGDYKNLILCFSQLVLLRELIAGQQKENAVLSIKAFFAVLFATSIYAYIFRGASQLIAIRGSEVPPYWMSSNFRFNGLFRDPNYYMALLIVALTLLINLRLKGELGRTSFAAMFLGFTVFGLLTYSKSFLILIAIVYVVYILLLLGKKRLLFAFFILAATAVIVWFALQTEGSPLQIICHRFTSAKNLDELTTGRSALHVRYLKAISESVYSLFFGYGLDAPYLELSPHNLYLEILYYLGIGGLLIFFAEITAFIRLTHTETSGVQGRSWLMTYSPLLVVAVLFLSLAGLFSPSTYAMFFLAVVSMLI